MADEGFLKRWSRRKLETRLGQEPAPEPLPAEALATLAAPDAQAPGQAPADAPAPVPVLAREADALDTAVEAPGLPTLEDVAALTPDSDYSSFVARGVDQAVRRSALKKLFADPHFNAMDRLDVYIDDYTKPSPVSEAMLASLGHARRLFARAVEDVLDAAEETAPAPDQVAILESPQHQQTPPETETR